jgi:hypothetical protein
LICQLKSDVLTSYYDLLKDLATVVEFAEEKPKPAGINQELSNLWFLSIVVCGLC